MSYVGGGSDLPAFYREEIGAVLSTTIEKYIYVAINKKFDGKIRLSYSKTEETDDADQIEHPLVRHALKISQVNNGIEIASLADIPSKGSGLGSSSSFTVGLLNALNAYKSKFVTKQDLASLACHIELDLCGEPIGKQDQFAAAFGGLNLIEFLPDERVSVSPVICSASVIETLKQSTLVFFTGRTRSASAVLADQTKNLESRNKRALMRQMVKLAYDFKYELESGSMINIGTILHENWILKTQMANSISDGQIDAIYQAGLKAGALGGKLLGAGNGGFMMFFVPPDSQQGVRSALAHLEEVYFGLDQSGSQIVFYQPN